jgi:hypothetical protein
MVYGLGFRDCGLWPMVYRSSSMVYSLWFMVYGSWIMAWGKGLVLNSWCWVCGKQCLAFEVWFMMNGASGIPGPASASSCGSRNSRV